MEVLAVNVITIARQATVEELAVEYGHRCQDKLPVEELSLILSQLPRQATRGRARR